MPIKRAFKPAKPNFWLIGAVQGVVKAQLTLKNRLRIDKSDLQILKHLPKHAGIVLVPNHADETDPRICIELARLSGKKFISMCNREAFDEVFGLAGWVLQHLGHFSVERGAHDLEAKNYAIDVIKNASDVLVIFPEGEIFYLNEVVQNLHTGAVELCMQAILEKRKTDPKFTAYLVPMGIKYHYPKPIDQILKTRIGKMETMLGIAHSEKSFAERLKLIQKTLLAREQSAHEISLSETDLYEEIVATENAILTKIEEKHHELKVTPAAIIDQSWQLSAEIRDNRPDSTSGVSQEEISADLRALNEVAHLSSWRPQYYENTDSQDRLAEALLKMERELYEIKRPEALARRDVYVKFSQPIDLSAVLSQYLENPREVRHSVTNALQTKLQSLVDAMVEQCKSKR